MNAKPPASESANGSDLALLYGEAYIKAIPRVLSDVLGVKFVFVGAIDSPDNLQVQALSFWAGDDYVDGYSYGLPNTPCQNVFGKEACAYPRRVQEQFPLDEDLKTFGIEAYAGAPLFTEAGDALGLVVALHDQPLDNADEIQAHLTLHAPRIGAELEKMFMHRVLRSSEQRYKTMFEETSAGIAFVDAGGHITRCNNSLAQFLGYSAAELLNRNFLTDFSLEADRVKEQAYVEQLLSGQAEHYRLEKQFVRKDGEGVWGDLSISAIRDDEGALVSFVGVVIDLTETKQVEDKFSASFRAAGTLMTISRIDDGHYEDINEEFTRVTGYTREDAIGRTSLELGLISGADREVLKKELLEHGCVRNRELKLTRKDGSDLYVLYNGELITFGGSRHLLSIAQDISGLKAVEQQLIRAKDEAESASRAKSEFLASMSHELRTPLNAVLGFAQLLQIDENPPLSSKQRGHVDYILQGGNHLLRLVNDILDLAKIEAHHLELTLEDVPVSDAVADCVALTVPLGSEKGIVFENKVARDLPLALRTDYQRFKQIILNLLSNATVYNKAGGTVTVHGLETKDGYYRVSVTDTGIGIAEDDQPDIFQMFHRLNTDPMVNQDGAGIGLTVSKLLVERMAGRIGFDSKPGIGSTFWVELPLATNDEALIWTDDLRIGIDAIDKDHQVIISLLNKVSRNCDEPVDWDGIIIELMDYSEYHFRREEAVMKACGYPKLEEHRAAHKHVKAQLDDLVERWRKEHDLALLEELRGFLRDWWNGHILKEDGEIAPYAKGKDLDIRVALGKLE